MDPIAIVGIGCRFPGGANNPEAFWNLVCNGVDALVDVPVNRWDVRRYFDSDTSKPVKTCMRQGGFLREEIDQFDPLFFGMSPREASSLDPQQRLLLETSWEAMEDAGISPESLRGSQTGVFVGGFTTDAYNMAISGSPRQIHTHTAVNTALGALAGRVAYTFDLRGPTITIDTACSSSLVATHYACMSLWNNECSIALAGGVNVMVDPMTTVVLGKAGLLSPDCRSKAFDANANGYVRGEGAGVIVLKPLSAAIASGDSIYALIMGTAVNQDGATPGMAVPRGEAQRAVMLEAIRRAGVLPSQVHYVEAHGTGTPVGDPTEAEAIGKVISEGRSLGLPCTIGSVKTNIGHLEAAAGIAGIIKTALVLKSRLIPPLVHLRQPNPSIPFAQLNLRLPRSLEGWPDAPGVALAGVNSFGITGTNAHVVMAEPPVQNGTPLAGHTGKAVLMPISANSEKALSATVQAYASFIDEGAGSTLPLEDISYSAGDRKGHHPHRQAVVASDREELVGKLRTVLRGESGAGIISGRTLAGRRPRVGFVFTGMGPQWWAMGRELMQREPVFRRAVERCHGLFAALAPWSLIDELMVSETDSRITRTDLAQAANFAIQVGLTELWRSWGVTPDVVAGHSVGEVTAAYVSGALSLEDAVRVSYHRGRLQATVAGQGGMLAAGIAAEEAQAWLADYQGWVSLAAVNGRTSVTLAGDRDALGAIAYSLQERGLFNRFLDVEVPYHSHYMDPLRVDLLEALAGLQPSPPSMPLFSTATGDLVDAPTHNAEYWWRNVRDPVLFADAVNWLVEQRCDAVIEVGPHPVLSAAIKDGLSLSNHTASVLPSLRRGRPERITMLESLGTLYTLGYPVAWAGVTGEHRRLVRLPAYAWQREHHWNESEEGRERRVGSDRHPFLALSTASPNLSWETELSLFRFPYLNDHGIQGESVFPGAGYVEAALAAGGTATGTTALELTEVRFERPLVVGKASDPVLRVTFEPNDHSYAIHSRTDDGRMDWTLHATGKVMEAAGGVERDPVDLHEVRSRCRSEIQASDLYDRAAQRGYQYGPSFQGITAAWLGSNSEVLSRIRVPDSVFLESGQYRLHPAILDAAVQTFLVPGIYTSRESERSCYLPGQVDRIRFYAAPQRDFWCYGWLTYQTARSWEGHLLLCDETGKVLVEVEGLRAYKVEGGVPTADVVKDWLYEVEWERQSTGDLDDHARPDYLLPPSAIGNLLAPKVQGLGSLPDTPEFERKTNLMSLAYVVAALRKLGWNPVPGEHLTAESLAERFGVVQQHRRLLKFLLHVLEDAQFLRRSDQGWEVMQVPDQTDPDGLFQELTEQFPADAAEFMAVQDIGPLLAGVLTGEVDPLLLLFPNGDMRRVEAIYKSWRMQMFNEVTRDVVAAAIAQMPAHRSVRILEVGAGTGSTTEAVVPALPANRSEFVFTDTSAFFGVKASRKLTQYPFISYRVLDIERDPEEQGFPAHQFDIVVAANVLHATADLRRSLANVRKLLAPGGLLVLTELTSSSYPLDLTFGLLDGWWKFRDGDLRQDHPLLTSEKWLDLLRKSGFTDVAVLPAHQEEGRGLLRISVLVAQNDPAEEAAEAEAQPHQAQGTWVLFADTQKAADEISRHLQGQGQQTVLVHRGERFQRTGDCSYQVVPDSRADLIRLADDILHEGHTCKGIIYLWGLDLQTLTENAGQLESLGYSDSVSVLHLVQALAGRPSVPRLWLVTRGAQKVGRDQSVVPAQATLWGLATAVGWETDDPVCSIVDLDPQDLSGSAKLLCQELFRQTREPEVAFRDGSRHVARLTPMPFRADELREVNPSNVACRLETMGPGDLDRLAFRETARRSPGPGGVEVRIHAAGLNFKDLMHALGMLVDPGPESFLGFALGMEGAGKVVAVGEGVESLKVGDPVIVLARHTLSSYVTVPAHQAFPKPSNLSYSQAATIMIAFATAYHSLHNVARLRTGEKVLVHAAAGGVGLAAVQVAKWLGAEVFATAGSEQKREYLRSLGIRHITDSRSLRFADDVMQWTNRQGVDVVLNSLQGDFVRKSLAVLAPFGRFIEIGRRDIERNAHLDLGQFKKALTFSMVDLDRMMQSQKEQSRELFQRVVDLFAEGVFKPIPTEVFSAAEVVEAFRHMARGKHIGRIAINLQEKLLQVAPKAEPLCRPDRTYLVTGGLSGFGLATAKWLAEQGACHLVLTGRRGAATPEAQTAVTALKQSGVNVRAVAADVADESQMADLLADAATSMLPLGGVVHAAMVLEDGLLIRQDAELFRRAMAPKVQGAWNLHRLTAQIPLDFFVLYSSGASLMGHVGQGNYFAANAFLSGLTHYRRARGLRALTVNWGALSDTGYLARHQEIAQTMAEAGTLRMTTGEGLFVLERLIRGGIAEATVVNMDWKRAMSAYPAMGRSPKMERIKALLVPDSSAGSSGDDTSLSLRSVLTQMSAEDRRKRLASILTERVSRVMGLQPELIDVKSRLSSMGLDSLMATELRTAVVKELSVDLSIVRLVQGPSIEELAAMVDEQIGGAE